jgi:arsenate reductase-like glutaredoxin family protein
MNKKDLQNAIREFLSKDGNSPITEANLTKAQLEDLLLKLQLKPSELVRKNESVFKEAAKLKALTERQKQVILAKERGAEHIGAKPKFMTKQKKKRLENNGIV